MENKKNTQWFNYKGDRFLISKDSYKKIEELGEKAGKYLTYNPSIKAWELTDTRNAFNSKKTWKYIYDDGVNDGTPMYDIIAWSLGYVFKEEWYWEFKEKRK